MTVKDYIAHHRPTLEAKLIKYLEAKKLEYADKPLYLDSIQKLLETVTGGKLVRGILILLAYESKKKTISEDAITLASAIELLHTALLIHDDIMDHDFLRRGKPTVFAQGIEDGRRNHADDPETYGTAVAICIGDLAFFMAFELIGTLSPSPHTAKILHLMSSELQKVGFAQITDVHFGINECEPTEEEILLLYTFKTARYSFSLPLKIGGILAKCDEKTLTKLENFGEELGIAFQIKDDELGIFGNETTVGKPVGSDIRENKKTLFRHILFKSVDTKTKQALQKIYGSDHLTEADISSIKNHLIESHVLSDIQKVREDKSISATAILNSIIMPEKYRMIFHDLIDFTNNRTK